jgi:hypothetical protein
VIVGFGIGNGGERVIFDGEEKIAAKNISPYLVNAPNVVVAGRSKPICNVPEMVFGSMPNDGGNLIIEENEYELFAKNEPAALPYIRRFIGSEEIINDMKRWCLWLLEISPSEIRKMPMVMDRVEACKRHRMRSKRGATNRLAETPTLFGEIRQPSARYIIVPRVSSERRKYIPMGFESPETIASDATQIIPNATPYHLGILTSSTHMAWTRAVCGRLEMRYRYSKDIVYNNFPWPEATNKQKADIEKLAQRILDARAKYPDSSLADLYALSMPPDLTKAHRALDKAVMKLYGFGKDMTEPEIVAELMERYKKLLISRQ